MNYFRYKQFSKDVITVAVGYYLRYALSYRDISEILRERGVNVHQSTVYRWVQEYAPILYQIWKKKHKKWTGSNNSVRELFEPVPFCSMA